MTINVDNVKELCQVYAQNPETRARYSHCLYAPAKEFTRRLFINEVGSAGIGRVLFLSGGAGSGKSALHHYMERQKRCLILDGTLSSLAEAREQIRLALACGNEVELIHVYCPVEKAVQAAIERAIKLGRGISLESLARTHFHSQATFCDLVRQYFDHGEPVYFALLDNSNYSSPVFRDLSFLESHRYSDLKSVHEKAIHAFDSFLSLYQEKAGKPVPDFIKEAFRKPGRKVA